MFISQLFNGLYLYHDLRAYPRDSADSNTRLILAQLLQQLLRLQFSDAEAVCLA